MVVVSHCGDNCIDTPTSYSVNFLGVEIAINFFLENCRGYDWTNRIEEILLLMNC
jgi:hypothetical protein